MKKTIFVCALVVLVVLGLSAQNAMKSSTGTKSAKSAKSSEKSKDQTPSAKKNAYTPAEMTWTAGPPFIPAGAKMAVLDGNPMGDEVYTLRLKVPDGYKVGPHWHPKREEVTVISGALKIGMGDKFEDTRLKSYPAGSFFYMDPDMHHFAQAKGATEIQIHGRGPVQFNYLDPKDDPSKNK